MDINEVRRKVKHNCNISDAHHWGFYSICGLLLRMRDLYRSEEGLALYEPVAMEKISPWIEQRDKIWHELHDSELENIDIDGCTFPPFDVDGINAVLLEKGILYGAGYGRFFKPNFFLADCVERRMHENYTIFITGTEYERDIESVPAMLQGRHILIRKDRIKALMWERFYEMKSKKYKGALEYAFSTFNISRDDIPSQAIDEKIDWLVDNILEIFLLHEVGEAMEDRRAEEWLDLMGAFRGTIDELKLRSLKDVLSDCSLHGPLQFVTASENRGLLAFYIAMLTGLHKIVFPEIIYAFQTFVKTGGWHDIETARRKGYLQALSRRDTLLSLWHETGEKEEVKKVLDEIK